MLPSRLALLCALAPLAAVGAQLRPALHGGADGQAARAAPAAPADRLPLPFNYDIYTFRGSGGRTAVVAAFSISAGLLRREDHGHGIRYRFDVSLVLADTARRTVWRTDDSVFVDFPRPLLRDHLLYTQVETQATPSRTTVQRVIMTDATEPGIGQLYGSPFPIPDYSGGQLMLSDVALGVPDTRAGWTRGNVRLALLPTSEFPASAFDVYYEIYNLPDGRRYQTEIALEPQGGAADRPIRLRFTDRSAGRDGVIQELRRVEAPLGRGRYRLTVTITDPVSGQSVSRSRSFVVRGWERGVTLVAALPRGTLP